MEILQKRIAWRQAFAREEISPKMDRNSKQSAKRLEVGVVGTPTETLLAD